MVGDRRAGFNSHRRKGEILSADKRSVATDALETLGTIITEAEKRDAIHLAVDNVVAGHTLRPGEDVGFLPDGTVGICDKPLGIVDPFLKTLVKKGERFWIVIYPRKITSLRHVWAHPDFPEDRTEPVKAKAVEISTEDAKQASEKWLREFAATADCPGYEDLIVAATGGHLVDVGYGMSYENDGEYLYFAGRDAHGEIPSEFWDHVEIVTGKKIDESKRASYFSCSC